MNRGDVYKIDMPLVDRSPSAADTQTRPKYVVVLRSVARENDACVLVCSTKRPPDRALAVYEVEIGTAHGMDHETVIDGRWPYTIHRRKLTTGRHHTTLPADVMKEVDLALAYGIGLI